MRIYLDHNATAPLHPAAAAVLQGHAEAGRTANPSSLHHTGQSAKLAVEEARRTFASVLQVSASEITFVSSGTEANVHALRGALAMGFGDRRRILASAIEHTSVLATLEACVRERKDLRLELLPVLANGALDLEAAAKAMGPDVLLASLMLANNETGVLQPVRELALLARAHGVPVHCDAAQALGKAPFEMDRLGVDLLTAGGHKFGGGLGCGVLVVRRGVSLLPLLPGHQEAGRRGGTENVSAIAAAAAALSAQTLALEVAAQQMARLRDRLELRAGELIPGTRAHGASAPRLPNTSSLELSGADGEAVVIALDLAGIAASTGAACASGTLEPSHVLLAMGLSPIQAKASVRFSLGATTTEAEIDRLLEVLPEIVRQVRAHV